MSTSLRTTCNCCRDHIDPSTPVLAARAKDTIDRDMHLCRDCVGNIVIGATILFSDLPGIDPNFSYAEWKRQQDG